ELRELRVCAMNMAMGWNACHRVTTSSNEKSMMPPVKFSPSLSQRFATLANTPPDCFSRLQSREILGGDHTNSGPTGDRWRTYQGEVWNQNCFPGSKPSGIDRTEIGKCSLRGLHN
ncbi:MAG TPA: hypothetical protein VM260_02465, partial [Pirellula sp.]|nr:hypothetical protein [Pirellula sp.]